MLVRLTNGANSYAHISKNGKELDVLLTPGRTPAESLRASAQEMRDQAARLTERAELVELAAERI
jgi:hypothetical protein